MTRRCDIAVVGSGFAGSLLSRVLAVLGYEVVLLERGTHPRFAIGESSTPLANLALERLSRRYGLADCWHLAAHGRWLEHLPEIRRGLKRGFSFYRHHPGEPFAERGLESERLLVAASPSDAVADTHWLRADVDDHLVKKAIAAGVDYRDRTELTGIELTSGGVRLTGVRDRAALELRTGFVIDASGPGGFLARHLPIETDLRRVETRSAVLFGHFEGVRPIRAVIPGLPSGPYPDDLAAVHHLLDEGWMYALRFDHGVTSAGFLLTPAGLASLSPMSPPNPEALWRALLERYPTLALAFADARPLRSLAFLPRIQHRLGRAAGSSGRWAVLPHGYAFVDPLFSTGIAWSLRAVERLALAFEPGAGGLRLPDRETLAHYDALLATEADQIDRIVAGAYRAMAHFDLFTAHAMLYFATVTFAEIRERLLPEEATPWSGLLGVGDPTLEPLPREALDRLRRITGGRGRGGAAGEHHEFAAWLADAIAPRNVAGLADPSRNNLYPADPDALLERHALLGLTRNELLRSLPVLRGTAKNC